MNTSLLRGIQPHGALLICKGRTDTIVQMSENAASIFRMAPTRMIGQSLIDLLAPSSGHLLKECIAAARPEGPPEYLPPLRLASGWTFLETLIHRQGNHCLIEMEPEQPADDLNFLEQSDLFVRLLTDISNTETLIPTFKATVSHLRALGDFDRMFILQMTPDAEGKVIAEDHRPGLPPLIGHTLSASNIPLWERKYALRHRVSYLADTEAVPVNMIPERLAGHPPIEMRSYYLRRFADRHIDRLRKLGVRTSIALSLIHDNRLWGLLCCQDSRARSVCHALRMVLEESAHLLSAKLRLTKGPPKNK